jgi:hypothetical protein
MAAINVSQATDALMSPAFLTSAALIVIGSLLAQVVVSWMRTNVRDIDMKGGDAVYSLVAGFLALVILPGKYGRPVALGSTATSMRVVLAEFGVV